MTTQGERRTPYATLALVAILLGATGVAGVLEGPEADPAPRPFDPPSEAEVEAAREAALRDDRVQQILGGRHVYLGAALRDAKVPGLDAALHPRLLDTWFYDYGSDAVAWAVVDPAQWAVVTMVPVDFPFQPPLVREELERARELALGVEEVAARFPVDDPLPMTAMLATGPETSCPINRCLAVAFIEEGLPQTDFLVLVNLSQDRVIKTLDGQDVGQEVYRP